MRGPSHNPSITEPMHNLTRKHSPRTGVALSERANPATMCHAFGIIKISGSVQTCGSLSTILFYGLLILFACGCTQARYKAANLPQNFQPQPHFSARHVDLSTLPRDTTPLEWLQPGDQVEVVIATGLEDGPVPSWTLAVSPTGIIDVPLVGETPVAGISPNAAAERIRFDSVRRGLFVDPKVTVSLKKKRNLQVSVVGAVKRPDTYEIAPAKCDLLTALTMAEGVSEDAGRMIQIRHSPNTLATLANQARQTSLTANGQISPTPSVPPAVVNVDLASLQSMPPHVLKLYDGSVVNVAREPKRYVSVMGLVEFPKKVEIPAGEDLTLLEAIAQAGGEKFSIADKVFVTRQTATEESSVVIQASLSDARSGGPGNLRLAAGDVVSVAETPATVVLQTIQTFFRVGFSAALPGL